MKHPEAHEAYLERLYAAPISLTAISREHAWERHIEESLRAVPLVDPSDIAIVDVGSGGGAPGIPLAIELEKAITLVESSQQKAAFLRATTAALGLDATVIAQRSEEATRGQCRDAFDLALARALASPPVALELVLPFLRPGGRAILWTTTMPHAPLAFVASQLSAALERSVPAGQGRELVVVRKSGPTPERFPRRAGMARKRPLAPLRSTA